MSQLPLINREVVPSEILQGEQNIQVYLPKGYENTTKRYPVKYILDGQWFFMNGVAIQETLRGEAILPEMIVIGIDLIDRPYRDSLLNNHWDQYISYIDKELVPFIDSSFRTTQERILFGWENNAFLATELLLSESSQFSCVIASNGGHMNDQMNIAFNKYGGNEGKKYLFIANSTKDIYTISYSEQLTEKLRENNFDQLIWEYKLFNNEVHESLPYLSLYKGLRFYYHNFGSLVFGNISEFNENGGINYLTQYFKERGERFGLDNSIDNSTKNSLIWLAWNQNDFTVFDLLMKEFDEVLTTKRYASAYWQNRFAQFYLKHNDDEKAIEYFNRGIQEFPDEKFMPRMYSGLGTAFKNKEDMKQAKVNYRMAVKIAKKNSDPLLPDYQKQLKDVSF
jgi:predicted alpha/beta superfamily hydrolase